MGLIPLMAQIFSLSGHTRHVDWFTFHISLPSLKFTIFIHLLSSDGVSYQWSRLSKHHLYRPCSRLCRIPFWLSLSHDPKKVWEKWLLVVPRFFLFMSCSSERLSQKGVPCNQPCSNIVLLTKEAQGENNYDFFLYFLWFYRVLIRVIIVQEMLIKQVPLVADTWGKLNHLPMDTKNLFYIFFLLLFFLSAFKFTSPH